MTAATMSGMFQLCGSVGIVGMSGLDVQLAALLDVPEVVFSLMAQPAFRTGAIFTQPEMQAQGHFCTNAGFAVQDAGEGYARDAELLRGSADADAQFGQDVVADKRAGMGRVVHTHGLLLVVVLIVHDFGMAVFKPEGDAPIPANLHAPMPFEVSGQRMQFPAREIHVVGRLRAVQTNKDIGNPGGVRRLNARLAASSEEGFQPFVTE